MKIYNALAAGLLVAGLGIAQEQKPTPKPSEVAAEAANTEGIYGVIKEVKAGGSIVINVDKGRDRKYDLAKGKLNVTVAEGLAVGDKVKIIESGEKDKKSVQIVRDVRDSAGQTGERARTGNPQK